MKTLITLFTLLLSISMLSQSFELGNQNVVKELSSGRIIRSSTTQGGVLTVDQPNEMITIRENRRFGTGFNQFSFKILSKDEGDGDVVFQVMQSNGQKVELIIYTDRYQVISMGFVAETKFL